MNRATHEPWTEHIFFSLDQIPVIQELKKHWLDIRDEHQRMRRRKKGNETLYPLKIYAGRWRITTLRSNTIEESYMSQDIKRSAIEAAKGQSAIANLEPLEIDEMYRYLYEEDEARNRNEHPTLTSILDPLYPDACVMYNYSSMMPGVRLAPHTGKDAGNIRVHLCIREAAGSWINVRGEERTWHDGEVFGFDDANIHSAWHNGRRERLVVIADFTKQFLRDELQRLNRASEKR